MLKLLFDFLFRYRVLCWSGSATPPRVTEVEVPPQLDRRDDENHYYEVQPVHQPSPVLVGVGCAYPFPKIGEGKHDGVGENFY